MDEDIKLSPEEQKEVEMVIESHDGDGPGDLDNLPESDFDGFPEDGVQAEEDDK